MADLFDRANYPALEPDHLVIGDRWTWKRTDLGRDYPPATHTLKYALRLEGDGTEIEFEATAAGSDYLVEVGSAETVVETAGTYLWQATITRTADDERITVSRGSFEILTNKDLNAADPRSHVKKVLDALEALIEGKASKDQINYAIAGRSVSRLSPEELIRWRNQYLQYYRQELAEKNAARGLATGRRLLTRFVQ